MEGGSNTEMVRQGKTVRYWSDLTKDFEWTHLPRAELLTGELKA